MAVDKETVIKYLKYPLKNLPRQLLTAFLYNTSCYFYWIVVPLLFNEQGATALELALLQLICFSIFSALAPLGGKLCDFLSPFIIIRLSMVFLTISEILVAIWQTNKTVIYISTVFWAFSAITFWPAAVGTIGKEAKPGKDALNTGLHSVSWSFGKAIGYGAGGFLKSALGTGTSLYIAIALNVVIIIIYPYRYVDWIREKMKKEKQMKQNGVEMEAEGNDEEKGDKNEEKENEDDDDVAIPTEIAQEIQIEKKVKVKWTVDNLKNKTYIYLGYILNLGLFGSSCVVTNQYIKIADYKEIGVNMPGDKEDNFVAMNFMIFYIAQTLMFVVMAITDKWAYRRSLMLLSQAIFLVYLLLLVVVFNPYVIFVLSFFAGASAGFSYQTATYYSVRASEKSKSLFAGISESVSSGSNAILPLCAGFLSDSFGVFAPMYFCTACMLVTNIASTIIYHIMRSYNHKRQEKRLDPSELEKMEEVKEPQKEEEQHPQPLEEHNDDVTVN